MSLVRDTPAAVLLWAAALSSWPATALPAPPVPVERALCAAGEVSACYDLITHVGGELGPADLPPEAAVVASKACAAGDGVGCFCLAHMHRTGRGAAKDVSRAVALYEKACALDEAMSCYSVGTLFLSGVETEKDVDRAGPHLRKALALLRKACDRGDPAACTVLGDLLDWGLGGEDGLRVSRFDLYRDACDRGHPPGCNAVGAAYASGNGVAKDMVQAAEHYAKSCDMGYAVGCRNLAYLYREGEGVPRDARRAAELWETVCESGDARACILAAYRFYWGEDGVVKDLGRGRELFRKACEAGDAEGCQMAGKPIERAPDAGPPPFPEETPAAPTPPPPPDSASLQRGLALARQGQHAQALDAFTEAIADDPRSGRAYRERARIRTRLLDLKGALADYDKAVELEPGDGAAWSARGALRRRLKDLDAAWADITRAIEIAPRQAGAYNNRGLVRYDRGDHEGAIADYGRSIELDPGQSAAFNNRGLAKEKLKDLEGAFADYTRAIANDPRNADAYANRGFCRNRRGDREAARQDYERALAIDPSHAFASVQMKKLEAPGAAASGRVILFGGTVDERWVRHSAAGGSFERDARLEEGGALVVRVPPNNGWGHVGLLSPKPLLWLDDFGPWAETSVTFCFDPGRTTGFVVSLAVPTWGGVAGNPPGAPSALLAWSRAVDGASAKLELHVNPHPGGAFRTMKVPPAAPAEVTLTLRPYEVAWSLDGAEEVADFFPEARPGQGFHVYVYSSAPTAHAAAAMALREIVLDQRRDPAAVRQAPASSTALFEGRPDERWEAIGVAGGDFTRFARYEGGALVVDVPKGNSWGKTGLMSVKPVLHVEAHSDVAPYRFTVRADPARTSGFVLALSSSRVPDMWPSHLVWASLIRTGTGGYDLNLHLGPYHNWSRTFAGPWRGDLSVALAADSVSAEVPGGPSIRAPLTGLALAADYYAQIMAHPAKANEPAALTLRSLTRDRVVPADLPAARRWDFVSPEDFEPVDFLGDLQRDLFSVSLQQGGRR